MERIASIQTIQTIRKETVSIEYSTLLKQHNCEFSVEGSFLLVGQIEVDQGWILHISVIKTQVLQLLEIIVPELLLQNIAFKIPKNEYITSALLMGSLGSSQVGKIVTIYPSNDVEALKTARRVIKLTGELKGPSISTDFKLGTVIFTRFGSFKPISHPETGQIGRFIIVNNQIMPDKYTKPFTCPANVPWPFEQIVEMKNITSNKLMNDRYKIVHTIKKDVKGSVLQGLYFKGFMNIKKCIIKEGKTNMWIDDNGRSISDRLTWQYDLYKQLSSKIPIPEIFDIFHENDNTHLAMEFIKGESLSSIINSSNIEDNCWILFSLKKKNSLISILIEIVNIIGKLHHLAIVHRDITPPNFIVGKNNKIFLIDMELAYSLDQNYPSPPYQLGTPGFMSPEQEKTLTPSVKEDIYALGALSLMVFTTLHPIKFKTVVGPELYSAILFFTQDEVIADLISSCLKEAPEDRPSIVTIKEKLEQVRANLSKSPSKNNESLKKINPISLQDMINSTIEGLSGRLMISADHVWLSQAHTSEYQYGLHEGLAGILYLLGKVKKAGFNIDSCMNGYNHCWELLFNNNLSDFQNLAPGLFNGTAGIALAMKSGFEADLLEQNKININLLYKCLTTKNDDLNLANGVAGSGLVLHQCRKYIEESSFMELDANYLGKILQSQQKDGSWERSFTEVRQQKVSKGFANGVAGIVLYLLDYIKHHQRNEEIIYSIEKALHWLEKKFTSIDKNNIFRKKTHKIDPWSLYNGEPGLSLCFLKAYEILNNTHYKKIAERKLTTLPTISISNNYSQAYGVAGLGEVYLEAYKILKDKEWLVRAGYITDLLKHTFQKNKYCNGFWVVETNNHTSSPDLMIGNSGIIHFLVRYLYHDTINFILM